LGARKKKGGGGDRGVTRVLDEKSTLSRGRKTASPMTNGHKK